MNSFLYRLVYADGEVYRHNRFEIIKEMFDKTTGAKLYIYTKDLFPTKALLMWN